MAHSSPLTPMLTFERAEHKIPPRSLLSLLMLCSNKHASGTSVVLLNSKRVYSSHEYRRIGHAEGFPGNSGRGSGFFRTGSTPIRFVEELWRRRRFIAI